MGAAPQLTARGAAPAVSGSDAPTGKPSSLEEAFQDGLTAFFRSLNRGMTYSLTEKGRRALGG
jgi:hypothetical protein